MILAVVPIGVLALWELSDAATTDTAAASVDKATALVGEPVTFTSTNPCTTACSLTWRRPDIGLVRFGGVIVGRGEQFSMSFAAPGSYQVVLDVGETCVGTSQLVCHSYAAVFVDVVDPAPVDPLPVVAPDPLPVVAPDPLPVVAPDPLPVDPLPVDPVAVTPEPVVVTPDPVVLQLVAPSDLNVTIVGGRPRLTWTNPADSSATAVVLERCKGTGCTSFRPIAMLTTDTTSFIESRITRSSTSYSYRLAVSDSTGTVYSNVEVALARR